MKIIQRFLNWFLPREGGGYTRKPTLTELGTEVKEAEQWFFGPECYPIKAIHTRLDGAIKIRIRTHEFPRVYIKSKTGITEHNIVAVGDHWELCPTGNANERPATHA